MQSSDTSGANAQQSSNSSPKARPAQNGRKRNDNDTSRKRPRIAQACEECRARKVRCDGAHPVCRPCQRRGRTQQECVYQADRANPGISLQYVARLEETIRRLGESGENSETTANRLAVVTRLNHGQSSPGNEQMQQNPEKQVLATRNESIEDEAARHEGTHDCESSRSSNLYHGGGDDTSPTTFSNRDEGVDGMGSIGLPENIYGVGTSSTASFMKMVEDSVAARLAFPAFNTNTVLQHRNRSSGRDLGSTHSILPAAELYMLPFRRTADHMVERYFEEVHILYPFLHRPRFMRSYRALWTDSDRIADSPTYCIMNMIFAMYCQITKKDSPEEKGAAADIFLRRAKQLLQVELLEGGSLELIQALLLMGQYLQSSEWPHRCWVVIGIAIRAGQGLGLHLPNTTANLKDKEDRELARRLWHGCVFMDRMVSMTLGRSLMISRADALSVPLPDSTDSECLFLEPTPPTGQIPNKSSAMEFYVQSLRLFRITEETLTAMYSVEATYRQATTSYPSPMDRLEKLDFTTIIKIDSSLRKWNNSLPHYLKVRNDPLDELAEPTLSRQANILHLRYLQIQILLFRPILSLLLAPEVRSGATPDPNISPCLPEAMALPCARNCILAALEAINLIYSRQKENLENAPRVETLPAWWYEVFFVYTAATALIPARVYAHIRGDLTEAVLSEGWTRSLQILSSLSILSPSARRCLATLQLINDEIVVEETGNATAHLSRGDNSLYPSARFPMDQRFSAKDRALVAPMITPLSGSVDLRIADGDGLAAVQGMQDFAWLDSLPVDLNAGDYSEFLEFSEM